MHLGVVWLAQSIEDVTLDPRIRNSSPMLNIELTLKNKMFQKLRKMHFAEYILEIKTNEVITPLSPT